MIYPVDSTIELLNNCGLIIVDLVLLMHQCDFLQILAPSLFLPFWVCELENMGSGEVFFTKFLQYNGASWKLYAGVASPCRVAMDTSLLCLGYSGPWPTFRNQFPSTRDESNLTLNAYKCPTVYYSWQHMHTTCIFHTQSVNLQIFKYTHNTGLLI